MKTIFSPLQQKHQGQFEFYNGAVVEGYENTSRASFILSRIEEVGLGPILDPQPQSLDVARRIHKPAYVDFLESAWRLWREAGRPGTALPYAWPARGRYKDIAPEPIDALLGLYSIDTSTGFVEGTWEAIKASQDSALTAADLISEGEQACFALCRPPGHHAGTDFNGGYCFLNNAAIAAQRLLDAGASRVTILDIDYHHGNGTQEIFYERADVQVISLHADPRNEYPYFAGYADEQGSGKGEGFNLNIPLPEGTDWPQWDSALEFALGNVRQFGPDVVIVSLGVDTFEGDPISRFQLSHRHFPLIGGRLASLATKTLFVLEGGYAVEDVGINVAGVLSGYEDAMRR
ncbi:histone deacetylase family protein [Agrobacterium cavarae]|uniref:histone deacetylase family protein n=1 Tax=Agrobacterium cavarae TaxID=2528239 RepID=UPI003FD072A2